MTLSIFFFASIAFSQDDEKIFELEKTKGHWTILGGYGVTHPGFAKTRSTVETVDLMLSRGTFITKEIGSSWYKGRHEIIVEIPFHIVVHPETTLMTGINLLGSWNATVSEKVVLYFLAGGGFIYTRLNVPELGSKLNGNYQAGVGLHYFIAKNTSIDINYRYHHISNAGTANPNDPLNSSKMLIGISFFK